MKLNKTFIAVAMAIPFFSSAVVQAADKEDRVFGSVFGEYYIPDIDKTESAAWDYMEKDWGYGVEIGYYLDANWAIRAELARDQLSNALTGDDVNGNRMGIDVLYHVPQWESVYIVGGLKRFTAAQDSSAVNLGVGYKHFFNQNVALFAEANRYQGIDETYGDAGIKVGMTYLFGSAEPKAEPTAAPVVVVAAPVVVAVADTDGDGVNDDMDKCANTAATHKVDAMGCTIYVEKMAAVGDVDIEVRFPFDSAVVTADQKSDVASLGAFMQRFPESTVDIEGHASNIGNPDYNMKLSERRAKSVADILKSEYNIAESRISAVGYGITRPRVEGKTREAHRANQRIEAKVTAKIKEPVLR